ncbi:MAG: DUF418 domain-containing protein [Melioribacteraceae bacterium]|nr:DUF418 domain-containing protein [Melioribacteraceae bacterium]MCF8263912.1 DUF418 domain-containing protein [Melioribacteraceae bacterium]MCF8430317.1 DUF418 domain-containing protein [Melioribacteraceae bacterium]
MTPPEYLTSKRIPLVDALRGLALMGLFMVHMVEYFELYWYNPEASIYNDITFFLFGGKAYAVFAFLFGLSFFLIMDGQKKRGVDFRLRFAWRLTLLLIAGVLHGVIYGGDILQILAITGFFLIPIYNTKNTVLIFLSVFFLLQIPAIIYSGFLVTPDVLKQPAHYALFGPVFQTYANGSFSELISITIWDAQIAKWMFMLESGRLSTIMGMSILGFLIGKIEFFRKADFYKKEIRIAFLLLLSFSVLLELTRSDIGSLIHSNNNWINGAIQNSISDLVFTLTGMLGFVLLYQTKHGENILQFLAPAGRMSLTIYVFQSLVFVPVFYGFGMGAYAFIGQTTSFYLGLLFWVIQLKLAKIWMTKYYFGPLEWIWRAATYGSFSIKFKR